MTPHHFVHGPPHRLDVQLSPHRQRGVQIIEGLARMQQVWHPECLLIVRHRHRGDSRRGKDRRGLDRGARRPEFLDPLGQLGHRRRGEQGHQRQVHGAFSADPGDQAERQQRVAADLEKVVADADARRSRPPTRSLQAAARWASPGRRTPAPTPPGSNPAWAAPGGQSCRRPSWAAPQHHPGGGNHERGQALGEKLPHLGDARRSSSRPTT